MCWAPQTAVLWQGTWDAWGTQTFCLLLPGLIGAGPQPLVESADAVAAQAAVGTPAAVAAAAAQAVAEEAARAGSQGSCAVAGPQRLLQQLLALQVGRMKDGGTVKPQQQQLLLQLPWQLLPACWLLGGPADCSAPAVPAAAAAATAALVSHALCACNTLPFATLHAAACAQCCSHRNTNRSVQASHLMPYSTELCMCERR